jgi:replicative DNA helicase
MRDLTPEEQARLEEMTGPQIVKPKYAWDDNFQKKLMGMILTDQYMLLQSIDKIQADYFSNEAHVLISKILLKHFQEHKAIPEKWIIENELKEQLKERDASIKLNHLSELHSLYDYYVPGLETREYLIDKITYFAKVQAVKVAFGKSLEKMTAAPEDEKTWSYVYEQMRQAMLVDRSYEPGVEYFMDLDEMFKRMDHVFEGKDRFTSGFHPIDESLTGHGMFSGQIGSWIGLPGTGKCLLWSTKILKYDGTVAEAQQIKIGDLLMGDDGTPRRVTNFHRLLDKKYEVKQSHAMSYYVNPLHILTLKNFQGKVENISIEDYLKKSESYKKSMKGYRSSVDFESTDKDYDFYSIGIAAAKGGEILHEQKVASKKNRLELLAGLIDGMGFTNKEKYIFYSKNKTIADAVIFISNSLGLASKKIKCKSKLKGDYYRVFIYGDVGIIPVKTEHKKINSNLKTSKSDIQVIDTDKMDLFCCIEVDGNKLFLLEDFTVVHNSLALVRAAVANVILGHKVLYLTMEMDELGIMQRFTSQFAKLDVNNLRNAKDDVYKTVEEFKKNWDDPNLLHVKQFPGGTMDVNGIRAFVAQLELRKWKPNLLIVDYVGEMKDDPTVKKYESAYKILRDLRGFGVEKQHCTFTCVQPNQSAAKLDIGTYIDESNIGTSFDQLKPLDALWSINQQTIEKDAEVGRVFVIKHRNGRSKFPFKIGFDYKSGTLDMFAISIDKYKNAMNMVQEKKAADISMDAVDSGKKKERKKTIQVDNIEENNYGA